MNTKIKLEFKEFNMSAEIFDTKIGHGFIKNAPYEIELISWGDEVYGSIGVDLGTEAPQPDIIAGGLAYTNQGNYFCIFFGQTPAWPVEYIGQINGDQWKKLLHANVNKVRVVVQ